MSVSCLHQVQNEGKSFITVVPFTFTLVTDAFEKHGHAPLAFFFILSQKSKKCNKNHKNDNLYCKNSVG